MEESREVNVSTDPAANDTQESLPAEVVAYLDEAAGEYVGRWNRLVSTTNWEKGRIICEWRAALEEAGAPPSTYTDESFSRRLGNVTPQHVGRLRRVAVRFGDVYDQYEGLYWSHFQAAVEWSDAEMWLEGAVQNNWSVAAMRQQRWEAVGAPADKKPRDEDIVAAELDEDASPSDDSDAPRGDTQQSYSEVKSPEQSDEESDDESAAEFDPDAPFGGEPVATADEPADDTPEVDPVRPFEKMPRLPDDLTEAVEMFKLAILAHKMTDWEDVSREDVLYALEALKQLALAPGS